MDYTTGFIPTGSDPGFSTNAVGVDISDQGHCSFTMNPDAKDEMIDVKVSGYTRFSLDNGQTYTYNNFTYKFQFQYRKDGAGCGGCTKCSTPPSTPSAPSAPKVAARTPLATGLVANDRGSELRFPLGEYSIRQDAGALVLFSRSATNLGSPSSLSIPYTGLGGATNVDIVTNTSGTILQVKSPQGLIYVVTNSNGKQYQLQIFDNTCVTPKIGGLYGTNGPAFDVWSIDNSAGTNQLVVTDNRSGLPSRSFTYVYSSNNGTNQWQQTDSGNLQTTTSWQATNAPNSGIYSVFQQVQSGGSLLKFAEKDYKVLGDQTKLVSQRDGAGNATNITAYYYNSSNWVQEIDYPGGNWTYYTYDTRMRVTTNFSAYGNAASPSSTGLPPNPSSCKMVIYSYSAVAPDDPGTYLPGLARTETTFVPGNGAGRQVSVVYRSVPWPNLVKEWHCPSPTASWNTTGNLLTITTSYTDPSDTNTLGQIKWQVLPNGTATLNNYQEDTNGVVTNIVVQVGQPDNATNPVQIVNGSQTSTALNSWGKPVSITTRVITNSVASTILSQQNFTYTDALQISYNVTDLANRTNQFYYSCCGLASSIDPDGVSTLYDYDTLKRQVAVTIVRGGGAGIKTTNILDAAGNVLCTQRIGTDGSVITLNQAQYDALGRLTSQTNALNGVTITTNVMVGNQMCITNTYPDAGTRIEVYYADGRMQSVSGTAVAPVQYGYGAEQDTDGSWREFTLTTKLSATGATNEWVKTYSDGAGNLYKTIYSGQSTNPFAIANFNSNGQLTNQIDPDGVSTIYAYNQKGENVLAVTDINQDHNIDYAGTDRITFTTNDVVNDHSSNVQRTQVYVWSTSGSGASNLISTVETSTDTLKTWNTTWNNGIGLTSQSTTVYSTSGNRFVTNTAPDNSYIVSTYQYGQLTSVTKYDANRNQIGSMSYGYDPHGRQNTVTDTRTGTTTYYFNNADQVSGILTPAPGTGQSAEFTTNFFDSLGRTVATTLPDNNSVTNVYYPTGQPQLVYGSRTYPVGYSYDSQGRMKTMTNWFGFIARSGTKVTTWNYDGYRGFLTNKTYDGNTAGPSYKYTAAGRLQTRSSARGINTTNSYNSAGDLSSVVYSDTTAGVSYGYDRRGRQMAVTNGTYTCTIAYNDAGEVLSESYTGGAMNGLSVTNGYDPLLRRTNNVALLNNVVLANITNNYDAASRLQTVSDWTNSATYLYLANSPLVSQISFNRSGVLKMTTTKGYDNLNRLTYIASSNSTPALLDFHAYTYNSANQRATVTNADGSFWIYQYDGLGQVMSGSKFWSDGTPVAGEQFGYSFDDIGNRQSTTAGADQWGANARYASYSANNLNQYTSRTVPGAIDVIGSATNTATVTVNNQATYRKGTFYRAVLPVANSSGPVYQSVTNLAVLKNGSSPDILTNTIGNVFVPPNSESFSYDADGNLTGDGRWIYTWDAENRLIGMTNNSNVPNAAKMILSFAYDWKGRRISKTVSNYNGSTYQLVNQTTFGYDGWNLLTELNATNNNLIRTYMWGLDLSGSPQKSGGIGGLLSIAQVTSNVQEFVCYDGNGNVSLCNDSVNSAVAAQYEYGPFGEILRATGPLAKSNPLRFSSKYLDDEDGLIYYGFRYYNPYSGSWLGRDPISERGSLNLYGFVHNDPIGKSDSLGLQDSPKLTSFGNAIELGNCGFFIWRTTFSLTSPADPNLGGFIVQYVRANFNVWSCPEGHLFPYQFGVPNLNAIDPGYWPFYEGWSIPPGKSRPDVPNTAYGPYHDLWMMPAFPIGTKGRITIIGKADYFDGGQLPLNFATGNAGPPSTLPSSSWFDPPGTPSSTLIRTLTVSWDCCCNVSKTKVEDGPSQNEQSSQNQSSGQKTF